ncbi:hypothetical protein PRZ48_006374 [Zasmidium cellare]|uniref:Uncharacterized protein n=1 Tax=Zasmidium cellare TaxID=395010 RepID=A0ABR0EN71_ZASCE|nr:hypothetical protein PRZ48_006374 [Zasmidium cellare]
MGSSPRDEDLLDPATTERQFYLERSTGLEREIWRPGDGDGDQGTDYFDRPGPQLPPEKRWRLFQSDLGNITIKNQPPRFVMLDDRAVYEVLESDIPRAKLAQNWPHEFGGIAKIRTRRIHRGRPAIKDPNAEGNDKYHTGPTGSGKEPYILSGEKDFQPVLYRYEPPQMKKSKRKRMPSPTSEEYNPRGHGHNQYTPKDMLVKNGAATFSLKEKKTHLPRPRNPLVPGSTSPFGPSPREQSTASSPEAGAGAQLNSEALGQLDPNEVPLNMGYIERQTFEQKMTARIIAGIQNNEDVKKVASELSKAHVKVAQQSHDLENLKTAMAADQGETELKAEIRKLKAQATRHEQKMSQQTTEIATLNEEVSAGKAREAALQSELDAVRQGQWWHTG